VREIVLAQHDQDAVVLAVEVEALGDGLVLLEQRLELARRAVLHQVGQVLEEVRRAPAAGLVGLRQGEDLLELVEDQQRHHGLAVGVEQNVVAVVQEFPQRFARHGGARLRPLAGCRGGAQDRLLQKAIEGGGDE
jgi:hypothetical protein